MLTRRRFTALALGSTALAGCDLRLPPVRPVEARGTIDTHVHFFNGTDVPVLGFLDQVDFVGQHGGEVPKLARSPLIRFIVGLLADLTPLARDEVVPPTVVRQSRQVLEDDDRARLAAYLADFQGGTTQTQAIVRQPTSIARAAPDDSDKVVLAVLEDAAGVRAADLSAGTADDGRGAVILRRQALPPEARPTPEDTARGLLDPASQRGDPQRLSIAGLIRWAMLLTRPRSEIMQQALDLYGRPSEARVFCNHLLDMTFWLRATERQQSPLDDQITLMSALARRQPQVLVLNFAPFCPLRAVVEGIGATLGRVQRAVTQDGFAGVKLYPPMGFRPDDNSRVSLRHSRRPDIDPARLNDALRALYRWCEDNDVPIASHASPSMGAGEGTAAYAAPRFWGPVLAAHPGLRVNLAHFGGFERHAVEGKDWQDELAELVGQHRNLYFDTAYWTEAAPSHPGYGDALAQAGALLRRQPALGQRMMYGSDWSMIAKEPDHPAYLRDKLAFVRALPNSDPAAIRGGNALGWLGLDRQGPQARRLEAFFGDHPAWRQIAPS